MSDKPPEPNTPDTHTAALQRQQKYIDRLELTCGWLLVIMAMTALALVIRHGIMHP